MASASRRLSRPLGRSLSHPITCYATRMQGGAHRPRQPDLLRVACRFLSLYIRLTKRAAKDEPHLFGPRAPDYFRDTVRMEQQEKEFEAAIRKVYGPPDPASPFRGSTLWTDRYVIPPERRRLFLKWFNEQYPVK
jgi:hypothetical protein